LHGVAKVGASPPPVERLTQYIGPPLSESFAALLGSSDHAYIELAIAAYRRRFEEVGMFENTLYPGIKEALEELDGFGHSLYVVTAKPHEYARQILQHFNISRLFRAVHGPDFGQRRYSKESLIRQACSIEDVTRSRTIMIGDRTEDILGAKENGLKSVGVTWGYGDRKELENAQPDRLVNSSEELVDYIRGIH
jgi:phosphoglycolate phosphatase